MSTWRYLVSTAVSNLTRRQLMNLVAVGTTAIALMVVGAVLLTQQNLTRFLQKLKSEATVAVHLEDDIRERELSSLRSELIADQRIENVRYISSTEALNRMKEILGESGQVVLQGLQENPLPASLELSLKPGALDKVDLIVKDYRDYPGVAQIDYGQSIIQQLQTLSQLFQGVLLFVAVVITLVAVIIIFNTIQLSVVSREKEIGILQLVGATRNFIATPYVIGGVVYGLVGSVVALILLSGVSVYMDYRLAEIPFLSIQVDFLTWWRLLGLLIGGTLLGGLASVTAVYRTLRTM